MPDYGTKNNSLCANMPGTIPRHTPYNTKTQIFQSRILKLFLKLRYVVVILCYLNWCIEKWGSPCSFFKLLFLKVRYLYLSRKPCSIKKPQFFYARALITHCARLSLVEFCAVIRMPNAIPWNHLKRKSWGDSKRMILWDEGKTLILLVLI